MSEIKSEKESETKQEQTSKSTNEQIRDKILYPYIEGVIQILSTMKGLNDIILKLTKILTEKYITINDTPKGKNWQAVGMCAFYVAYKAVDKHFEDFKYLISRTTPENIVFLCGGACDKEEFLQLEKEILEMNDLDSILEPILEGSTFERKSDLVDIKNRPEILEKLDSEIYPVLLEILYSLIPQIRNDLEMKMTISHCMSHLVENYIFKFNSPRDDWINIGLGALFLLYKILSLGENYDIEITTRDLKMGCSKKVASDKGEICTIDEIVKFEGEILKMNNYLICPHIYNLVKSPKTNFKRIAKKALRNLNLNFVY